MGFRGCLPTRVLARLSRGLRGGLFALCAGGLFASAPALAGETTVRSEVGLLEALSIVKGQDMDFGVIAPSVLGGTVVMTGGALKACVAVGGLVHTGACQPAEFSGFGVPNRIVRIKLPPASKISLNGPGTAMVLDKMTLYPTSGLNKIGNGLGFVQYRVTSPTGIYEFDIGGTLHMNPNQLSGHYSATFKVQVNYN